VRADRESLGVWTLPSVSIANCGVVNSEERKLRLYLSSGHAAGDTVAIGLGIVAHGFEITAGSVEAQPEARDSRVFLWRYRRGEIEQDVYVVISATAMASATEALPFPIDAIVATRGRSAVEDSLKRGHNPTRIAVDSSGSIWEHPAD